MGAGLEAGGLYGLLVLAVFVGQLDMMDGGSWGMSWE